MLSIRPSVALILVPDVPDAVDRWILRLVRSAYQLGYDDAERGEGRSAFYSRRGPYDNGEAAKDDDQEQQLLREMDPVTRGQARSG